jgi:hypothetical protein
MKISRTVSFGMGAVMALVIGSGTAYAATGGKFILGKSNSAGKTTTLSNKNGTALSLSSKAGTPSLKVNRTTKVPNLNADLLDGLDQSKFALAAGTVRAYDVGGQLFDLDQNGTDDAIIANAACPAGTQRTGGGASDFTVSGYTVVNAPDTGNSWTVGVAISESTTENPDDVIASIVCYSPRGVPSGGYRVASSPAKPSADVLAKMTRVVASGRMR